MTFASQATLRNVFSPYTLLNNRRIQLVWRRLRSLNPPLLLRCGSGLFCWRSDVSDELVTDSGGKKIGFFIQNNTIIFSRMFDSNSRLKTWTNIHILWCRYSTGRTSSRSVATAWSDVAVSHLWLQEQSSKFRSYLRSANFTALLFSFPLFQTEVDEPAGC